MPHIPDYDTPIYNQMMDGLTELADWEIELLGGDPKDPLFRAELHYSWEEFSD